MLSKILKMTGLPEYLHKKDSYSQDGEDMVLKSFFEDRKDKEKYKTYKGFYVDVGAHHPFRFSNTAYFYQKGWRGINIEPTPDLIKHFRRYRKRDINLNVGITNQASELTFFVFNDHALNSFDNKLSQNRNEDSTPYKIVKELKIQTRRLADILDEYLPENQKIDFLSIDAEGLDLEILKSNNWEKYVPDFILVEQNLSEFMIENIDKDEIYNFLTDNNYNMVAKTKRTSIFEKNGYQ
jgi:FkbM family methyltransferase